MSASPAARPTLRELQLLVWKLLVAPEGAAQGLSDLEQAGALTPGILEAWIAGDERLSALGRVDIYATMYFYRIRDSLKEDFPKTLEVIGEDRFHNLVTDYLLVHPSSHWSLRYAGLHLSAFLRTHELLGPYPFLADLAAVEWARADLFQMENAPVLSREELAAVPPERWGDLFLRFAPAVSILALDWDLAALWDALEHGEGAAGALRAGQQLLVWRPGFAVEHAAVPTDEAGAIRAVLQGRTFGDICEDIAGASGDVGAAAARASELLVGWLSRGLVTSCALTRSKIPSA
jgi:hypothetical protein